jgi:hypothetical protein
MKSLFLGGLPLCTVLSASAPAQARWYIAHSGDETCVPLDDIGENNERLYDDGGQMHAPEDLARRLRSGSDDATSPQSARRRLHATSGRKTAAAQRRSCWRPPPRLSLADCRLAVAVVPAANQDKADQCGCEQAQAG